MDDEKDGRPPAEVLEQVFIGPLNSQCLDCQNVFATDK